MTRHNRTRHSTESKGLIKTSSQSFYKALLYLAVPVGLAMEVLGDNQGDRWTELGSGLFVSALIGLAILELQSSLEESREQSAQLAREMEYRAKDEAARAERRAQDARTAAADSDRAFQGRLLLQMFFMSNKEADLIGIDVSHRDLEGLILRELDLREACFDGANARRIDLTRARLEGASLRMADLSEAQARGLRAEGADFTNADLRNASLDGAALAGCIFDGARVARASFIGAEFDREALRSAMDFEEAVIE